jgi:hypothetical protein
MYEGRIKGPTGDWMPGVFTGDSQHVTFEGLMPGTIYTAQVRALGGSTGQSEWSDPSSHTWRRKSEADCRLQSAADTAAPYSNIDSPESIWGCFASQGHAFRKILTFSRTSPPNFRRRLVNMFIESLQTLGKTHVFSKSSARADRCSLRDPPIRGCRRHSKGSGAPAISLCNATRASRSPGAQSRQRQTLKSRFPHRNDFDPDDEGKSAYYALRWLNTKGDPRPRSPICSAIVQG